MVATYLMQVGPEGPVKIGKSRNPSHRLRTLQSYCPYPITMLVAVPARRHPERRLHEELASSRLHGEWFTWSPEVKDVLRTLLDAAEHHRLCPCPRCMERQFTFPLRSRVRRLLRRISEGKDTHWDHMGTLLANGLAAMAPDGVIHVFYEYAYRANPTRFPEPLLLGDPTCSAAPRGTCTPTPGVFRATGVSWMRQWTTRYRA